MFFFCWIYMGTQPKMLVKATEMLVFLTLEHKLALLCFGSYEGTSCSRDIYIYVHALTVLDI